MKKIYLTLSLLVAMSLGMNAQRAKSVILVYLDGGPAQTDTFDPKPNSSRDYFGNFKGVSQTNVEGIYIGEKLPLLAEIADKYTLIRSTPLGKVARHKP